MAGDDARSPAPPDGDGPAPRRLPPAGAAPRPPGDGEDVLHLPVGLGRRLMVVSNLLLGPAATPSTAAAAIGVAKALDGWQGPGLVVVAGNLFDLSRAGAGDAGDAARTVDARDAGDAGEEAHPGGAGRVPTAADTVRRCLDAHPRLTDALRRFAAGDDRRVVVLPGAADVALGTHADARRVVEELSVQVAARLDLHLTVAAGTRRVRVEPAAPPGPAFGEPTAELASASALRATPDSAWQQGLERLSDPAGLQRFLTSRLLYRRFARFAWYLLIPFAVVAVLRLPFATGWLGHLLAGHPLPRHAVAQAVSASWGSRLTVAAGLAAAGVVALAVVLGVLSRKAWSALGGGDLAGLFADRGAGAGTTANDALRAAARQLLADGYHGLVTGGTLQAELTHLGDGFFACAGTSGEVVEEHPGRLGLPPVFLHHQQLAWVEVETGAELHARLLVARADQAPATVLERLAVRHRMHHDVHPVVVAAYPNGGSWPPPPDLSGLRLRSRRARRWGSAAIAVAGALDLAAAVTPPLRAELHLVLQVVPLVASQAAGALVALAGIGLLALARGVRRGQRRAWAVSCAVLAASIGLHLVHAGALSLVLLSSLVLVYLLANREQFTAPSDWPSLRSAAIALVAGVVALTAATTALVEVSVHIDRDPGTSLPLTRAVEAVLQRMVGLRTVPLPPRLDRFLAPSLVTVGLALAAAAVLLATRPVVERRRLGGRSAELHARDVVRRHGSGTLDYFALRSDKSWFFHRDSAVAYANIGGICLVSPDPIGPPSEREAVWAAFRRFADTRGWVVAVMGASEDWLPLYRAAGMHDVYIGDEAVVDIDRFSLAGGQMKGLRQAHNRIAKRGYQVSFHDPARLGPEVTDQLAGLMAQSRRGEFERGFSMMLGRIFDPRDEGLLLCVVHSPDGTPAAICQFVPAGGIGGYSLDLMRRDRGEHPNGLIDFALVSTIEYLRSQGKHGLSLNFAALRSVLDGERGDGYAVRVERWALKKMSSFLQIETLWRFNAKYQPDWLPRYVVYDSAEHLVPAVLAILRAESLWEVPVVGRIIAASDRRAHLAAAEDARSDGAAVPGAGSATRPAADAGSAARR